MTLVGVNETSDISENVSFLFLFQRIWNSLDDILVSLGVFLIACQLSRFLHYCSILFPCFGVYFSGDAFRVFVYCFCVFGEPFNGCFNSNFVIWWVFNWFWICNAAIYCIVCSWWYIYDYSNCTTWRSINDRGQDCHRASCWLVVRGCKE